MSYAAMDGSATQFAGQNGYMPECVRARDDESRRARDDEDDDDDATRWMRADAVAGGTPITATSKVLQITPNAMPSAPSTSCAANPIRMKGNSAARSKVARSSMILPNSFS